MDYTNIYYSYNGVNTGDYLNTAQDIPSPAMACSSTITEPPLQAVCPIYPIVLLNSGSYWSWSVRWDGPEYDQMPEGKDLCARGEG